MKNISKRLAILCVTLGLVLVIYLSPSFHIHQNPMPKPDKGTYVRIEGEPDHSYDLRMKWIDAIHGGKSADWRTIEAQNRWEAYQNSLNNPIIKLRNNDEWVAGGNILGQWIERGSTNNAGSITTVDYDPIEDMFYAMGAGGSIFKGDPSGYFWEVVNDKLRFSSNLLKHIKLENGKTRLVAAVEGYPYFSDDKGVTWKAASGVLPTSDGWALYDCWVDKEGIIFYLARKSWENPVRCYASYDNGETYKTIIIFSSANTNNYSLSHDKISDNKYILEYKSDNLTTYKYDKLKKKFEVQQKNISFNLGQNYDLNLAATTIKDTASLYVFNDTGDLITSKNLGLSWEKIGNLPTNPWSVGLFISPSDPRKQFYGEVDSYRSLNYGKNWIKMSNWGAYYSDPSKFLHADIMYMNEYTNSRGGHFLVNCNHGGIYISYDYGLTWQNIGIIGLNVSQYYDVRTYPSDPFYVFAGSQDQGQQRGRVRDDEAAELLQNISGDYGHLEFTGNGKSLWSVYPGGSIGFYSNPFSQNYPISGFEIDSKNETVWIPPIMPGPDPSQNRVIAAGGSLDKNSFGSFLLDLEFKNNEIQASQLPFDFATSGGKISAMAIHPLNKKIWYVASTNGLFYRSDDGGLSFTRKTTGLATANYLYGSCIFPSQQYPNRVFLTGNGYNNLPVYISHNNGDTWTSFSSGLPRTTVFNIDANEDESLIFAATEAGPYVYIAKENKWFPLAGSNTPSQTFWSVEYVEDTKTARFATYGRGIWDFVVKDISSNTIEETHVAASNLRILPNPATDYIRIYSNANQNNQDQLDLQIIDNNGRIIWQGKQLLDQSIDVRSLAPGKYIVRIYSKKNSISRQFIKL
jgi:hypothetical protein